jgi:chromate transport protein ChrA
MVAYIRRIAVDEEKWLDNRVSEIVEVRFWTDSETFLNGIALGQITPGPIVITAAFAGYIVGGLRNGNRPMMNTMAVSNTRT